MRRLILVLALVLVACYGDENGITDPPEGLAVTFSAASIPADGFSTVALTARVDPKTRAADRSITFTTTAGTFVGAAAPGTSLVVTADVNGLAQAALRSSTTIETANVTVRAGTSVTRALAISFTPVNPTDVIRISAPHSPVPADGASITQVSADIAPSLPAGQRSVKFTTSIGVFTNNTAEITVTASSTNRAVADLRASSVPGTARITASVAGVTAETSLTFVPALPEALTLNVSALAMKPTEEITVTSTLTRTVGAVTAGRLITYTATDAAGSVVGLFRNVTVSGATGTATAVFFANGAAPGLVTIRATTPGIVGAVAGEVTVRINP